MRRRLVPSLAVALAAVVPGLAACGSDDAPPTPDELPPPRQARLFDYDRKAPLNPRAKVVRKRRSVRLLEVGFRSFDGQRVPGLLALPRGRERHPCVLVEGGLGATKMQSLTLWLYFSDLEYGALAVEPRFHGERQTRRLGWREAARDPALLERMLRESIVDLRRAIDYLQARPECDARRIGFLGTSLGAIVGAVLAGVDRRVKAPVLLAGGGGWREILRGRNPLLPGIEKAPRRLRRALRLLAPLDPALWAKEISPRDVLIVNGRDDRQVPTAAAKRLQRAALDPKQIVWYRGGHDPFDPGHVERTVDEVDDFLFHQLG